jgi:hypothetical protein
LIVSFIDTYEAAKYGLALGQLVSWFPLSKPNPNPAARLVIENADPQFSKADWILIRVEMSRTADAGGDYLGCFGR